MKFKISYKNVTVPSKSDLSEKKFGLKTSLYCIKNKFQISKRSFHFVCLFFNVSKKNQARYRMKVCNPRLRTRSVGDQDESCSENLSRKTGAGHLA